MVALYMIVGFVLGVIGMFLGAYIVNGTGAGTEKKHVNITPAFQYRGEKMVETEGERAGDGEEDE